MPPMIIENYTKTVWKNKNNYICKAYFLSFPRLKMYFNYLTVCEEIKKNPSQQALILLTLRVKYYFYYANKREKTIIPRLNV